MGEPIAVLALRRKRDQISGTIAHYERLLRETQHDLAHTNASLRLFEATGEARRGAAGHPPACPTGHPGKGLGVCVWRIHEGGWRPMEILFVE